MAERPKKITAVVVSWPTFWPQFIITFPITLAVLWVGVTLREAAIESNWLSPLTVVNIAVPITLTLLYLLGASSHWKHRAKDSPTLKHIMLGTSIALMCYFFAAVLIYSGALGSWVEFATVTLTALAALWVFFHDLIEGARQKREREEQEEESAILRCTKVAIFLTVPLSILILIIGLFGYIAFQPRTLKVAVSLPFGSIQGAKNSLPLYKAITQAYAAYGSSYKGYTIELIPFDDSSIDNKDCTEKGGCPITSLSSEQIKQIGALIKSRLSPSQQTLRLGKIIQSGQHEDFTDFIQQPQLMAVIGPFNSGVAVRELPALNQLSIPLISPANSADCLTNPNFSDGDCSVERLDKGYYFRTATTDSIRQKVLVDYVVDVLQLQPDQVVIFAQSGPKSAFFARSFANAFIQAWQDKKTDGFHAPIIIPIADKSTPDELHSKLGRLPSPPAAILYAGTGDLGAHLYSAMMSSGQLAQTKFLASGSIENFINSSLPGPIADNLYDIQPAAISPSFDTQPQLKAALNGLRPPREATALAYDTTTIVLDAIRGEIANSGDYWKLRTISAHLIDLPKVMALPNVNRDLFALLSAPLRQHLAKLISETNTGNSSAPSTSKLTGTYSFSDNGDVNGAAGAELKSYCPSMHQWVKLGDCHYWTGVSPFQ